MMEAIFEKLEKNYLFNKTYNTVFTVMEAILGILAGIYIKASVSHPTVQDILLSLVFTAFFLTLVFRRAILQESFSLSGLGELKATIGLEKANQEIERKNLIGIYLNEAIINLNSNTCDYTGSNVDTNLCDQSVENGLKSLYQPFISNTPNLLNTGLSKFTVGAYLDFFLTLPAKENPRAVYHPKESKGVFILKDDFNLRQLFVDDMLDNGDVMEVSFDLQRQMLDSFKHRRFIHSYITIEGTPHSFMCAAIPDVCDTGSFGVFFLISEALDALPTDLENVTTIFGRVFSNWLVRYNECIRSRCFVMTGEAQESIITPPEVIALGK